ncbi:MAG: hypothetical protein ACRDOA_22250 [Streptosporangiaceae bacterium]
MDRLLDSGRKVGKRLDVQARHLSLGLQVPAKRCHAELGHGSARGDAGVPGLDLPGLGNAAVARGFGCRGIDVQTTDELEHEFKAALSADTATVIVVRTQPQKAML